MRIWAYQATTDPHATAQTQAYELSGVVMHDVEFGADHARMPSVPGFFEKLSEKLCGGGDKEQEQHQERLGVTAVACAGTRGPFISGTSTGSVYVINLEE